MGYMYRDKKDELHYKTDRQIHFEGACMVFVGMLIALLCVYLLK